MTFIRHGRVSNTYKNSLRSITKEDYKKLEIAAVEAILDGEPDIILSLPYTCKIPKGFPKGVKVKAEGSVNFFKAKAKKVLQWLNDKGHSVITLELIRVQAGLFTRFENALEKGLQ